MSNKAIIAGASGLIGSNLLQLLLQHPAYTGVVILVRKKLEISHQKLTQLVVNFDDLGSYKNELTGDVLFSCLGTTKAKTPDKQLYYKIDHDYPVQLAQLAAANGVKQYHLVSSVGADVKSGTFYLKTKGETERDVTAAGVNSLYIYRPSFLVGDRPDARLGEKIARVVLAVFDPLLIGSLKKYKSIAALTVAQAMLNQSLQNDEGVFIYPSDKIKELA
jgi:uncharacterized protein YbjT (DUF2867 family)